MLHEIYFFEYYRAELAVRLAVEEVRSILDEKTMIYQRTQPSSPVLDSERVDGGKQTNKNDAFVIELEQKHIQERLDKANELLDERMRALENEKVLLSNSKQLQDRIYYLKYVKGLSPKAISKELIYSEAHIYRVLRQIKKKLRSLGRDFIYEPKEK